MAHSVIVRGRRPAVYGDGVQERLPCVWQDRGRQIAATSGQNRESRGDADWRNRDR